MQPTLRYRRYVLGLLLTAYIFSCLDRQILYILIEPIKSELGLSDTQIGLLGGFSFALFYATLGMPIALLADRYSRKTIITLSLVAWSGMTALSGAVVNFWQMLIARMGVAVGEAGCNPCAHSLISDFYPTDKRATALAVYQLGIPIGVMLGLLIGGWISQYFGWRTAFVLVGSVGVAFAILLWLTLKEPLRGLSDRKRPAEHSQELSAPTFLETLRHLWALKSFFHIVIGTSLIGVGIYTFFMWSPSFLIRSYGMTSGQVGTALALFNGLFGGAGIYLGGMVADRLAVRNQRWYLLLPCLGAFLAFPFAVGIYLSGTAVGSMAFMGFPVMLALVNTGPCYSLAQRLSLLRMRALAAAILLFMQNMIGLGLGPQITGFISDLLAPRFGDESLRYALLASSLAYPWAALHLWLGSRTLTGDLASVEGGESAPHRPLPGLQDAGSRV